MAYRELLKHPIETIRTDPIGTGMAGFFASGGIVEAIAGLEFMETSSNSSDMAGGLMLLGSAAINIAMLRISGKSIDLQFRFKNDIENDIKRYGYHENLYARYVKHWDDRQVARVVAKKYNFLDKFKNLCERNKETSKLTWLPHL